MRLESLVSLDALRTPHSVFLDIRLTASTSRTTPPFSSDTSVQAKVAGAAHAITAWLAIAKGQRPRLSYEAAEWDMHDLQRNVKELMADV